MAALAPPGYERRRPEETVLYRVLREHLATFLEVTADCIGDRLRDGQLRRDRKRPPSSVHVRVGRGSREAPEQPRIGPRIG